MIAFSAQFPAPGATTSTLKMEGYLGLAKRHMIPATQHADEGSTNRNVGVGSHAQLPFTYDRRPIRARSHLGQYCRGPADPGSFAPLLLKPTREFGVEAVILFCWINSSRRVMRIDYRAPPGNDDRGINSLSSLSI